MYKNIIILAVLITTFIMTEYGQSTSIMEQIVNETIPVNHNSLSSSIFYFKPDHPDNFTFFAVSPFNFTFRPKVLYYPEWVHFDVSVPKFFPSGNYTARIYAQSLTETLYQDINISVLPHLNYNYTYESPFIASTGDVYFKYVNITNTGNKYIDISARADHEILKMSQNIKLYPNVSAQIPYLISVPKDYKLGDYKILFTLFENETKYFNISVFDREGPKIDKVEVNETTKYSKNIQIKVFVSDNKGIDKVTLTQDDKSQFLQNHSEGYYYGNLEATRLGDIDYFLEVNDTSGNRQAIGKRFSVTRLEGIQVIESIAARIKQGYIKESELLNSINPIKFTVTLKDFTFKPAPGLFINNQSSLSRDNYTLYVSTEQRIDLTQGRAEPIESKDGKAKLFFSSNTQGHFEGKLALDFDKNIADPVIVPFAFNVGIYTVTSNRTMYLGGRPVPCSPDDTGFYENSSYNCLYKFPIDIPESSIGIFTTQNEIDSLSMPLRLNNTKIAEEKNTIQMWGTIYFVVLVGIVASGGILGIIKSKGITFT